MKQLLIKIAPGLSSPAWLLAGVWCVILIAVAVGPIDFPRQPSVPVLVLVAAGVSLFVAGQGAGAWCFRVWLQHRPIPPAPQVRMLNVAVVTTSVFGAAGMALIVLDRMVLSGISSSGYAELLRCSPALIDFIAIKRTPLLYLGYLTFSLSYASLVLFVLNGEEISGWRAILAQLSFLAPIGYAVVYSGRMPILLMIVLVIAAMLVRISRGRRPFPHGHYLHFKMIAVLVLFGIYTNASWSSRRAFCTQMRGVIQELRAQRNIQEDRYVLEQKLTALREAAATQERKSTPAQNAERRRGIEEIEQQLANDGKAPAQPKSGVAISAAQLSQMIEAAKALPAGDATPVSQPVDALLLLKREDWGISPRAYVQSAVETGRLPPGITSNLLNTYFYLSHGVYVLDRAWHDRAQFSPHWGIYEVGVLSPVLRTFFPQSEQLQSMAAELKAARIQGVFPTVWGAAFIDFGVT